MKKFIIMNAVVLTLFGDVTEPHLCGIWESEGADFTSDFEFEIR